MATAPEVPTENLAPGQIHAIALDRLMLSGLNVRQTERAADIEGLAESIAIHGLKQNLVVVPAHFATGDPAPAHLDGEPAKSLGRNVWADRFEVIAGGRRLQAMQLLAEQDRIPADHPVPCRLEAREEATDTSLIENIERVTMNPVDELEAYRAIVSRNAPDPAAPPQAAIELCARRFGKSARHVAGRLRLAALAPEILEALRDGTINLESAKAYASVEDQDLQREVFAAQLKSNWRAHAPAIVRDALNGHSLGLDDPLVKFVGLDAYLAAGGRVVTDLFMGAEGAQRATDVQLVEDMARKLAEPMVAPRAKADGFKAGLLAEPSGKWPRAPEGMVKFVRYYQDKDPTRAELKKSIAVYGIDDEGTGIEKLGHFHVPPPPEPREERDWEAERAAADRQRTITRRAARMAAYELGQFTGTPLEGKAFWPAYQVRPVELDAADAEHTLVAVLIRVPTERVEANKAEAERLIDAEAADEAEDDDEAGEVATDD